MEISIHDQERFWEKVDVRGPDECWEWQASRHMRGYGHFSLDGVQHRAHRISWTLTNSTIPDDLHVLHRCDNPPCVNPAHLWLGTHMDNMVDMMAKGRHVAPCGERNGHNTMPERTPRGDRHGSRLHPERRARGERQGSAKLTADQVRAIRADDRLLREIAADYGVAIATISSIKRRLSWAHITD